MKKHSIGVVSAFAVAASLVFGSVAAADDLTPEGGDRAASKDGAVPAYAGRQPAEPGWEYGKFRGDFWKHRNEKPLYSIDASNVDKYADRLTPGQIQLIKQKKNYRMDVYPSHRECQVPDAVAQNSKANLAAAKLAADGETIQTALFPGVPFPQPKSGAEAMLNFEWRYRGEGVEWPSTITTVSPRPGGGDWIDATAVATMYFPSGKPGKNTPQEVDQFAQGVYFQENTPAALAGQAFVQRQFFNKEPETYYYFPGQRRVRRMPAYTHDAPLIGFENQYLIDEGGMFNGALNRFNWKLVGKKELIVPYNAFGMYKFNSKLRDVITPDGIAAGSRRYETHRVWVVEATLKPSARHVASKKVFYLDEDSWLALTAEDYDAQGKLWKVRESYPIPVWELGGTCDAESFAQYDLINGRYITDQSPIGQGKDLRWFTKIDDPRFKADFYTSEALRSVSER